MSLSNLEKIRVALDNALNNFPDVPLIGATKQIAWENKTFTPTSGYLWLRPQFIQTSAPAASAGYLAPIKRMGIYTINVFGDKNKTSHPVEKLAGDIEQYFYAGTILENDGIRVTVLQGSVRNGILIDDSAWVNVPVILDWYSYESRQ